MENPNIKSNSYNDSISKSREILYNLNEANLENLISIESCETVDNHNFLKIGKVIVDSKDSNRRIEEMSEVKMFLRKYLCLKEDKSMRIFNKDYKNICKKKIDKMSAEEVVLRKCLLNSFDKQVVLFVIHKDTDPHQLRRAKTDLKIEDMSLYEDYLYYQIIIESVIYPQPAEPKQIQQYEKFIKKYQDEIRYLISVENYTDAISWCNSICSKFFTMNKEIKKQMTEDVRKKLQPELKSVILNKTMAYMKKQNKDNTSGKDYEDVIKVIKEYYSLFPEKDEKYVKITKRLIKCYLEIKDLEMAENVIKDLSELSKGDDEIKSLENQLLAIRGQQNKKNKKNILEMFKSPNEDEYDSEAFIWDHAVEDFSEIDLNGNLDFSVANLINA
jgi:hypothetical protein